MMFFSKLKTRIRQSGTRLCLGIDPFLPVEHQLFQKVGDDRTAIEGIVSTLVTQAIEHKLPVVKFQSAYFEAFGTDGLFLLKQSIEKLKQSNVLVVLDAKRGDISSTMSAYGKSAFDYLNADCLTVNPYMGVDTVEPLLPWLKKGRGVYVVWVTSNKSAEELQFLKTADQATFFSRVYTVFDQFAAHHGVRDAFGYVLGATKIAAVPVKNVLQGLPESSFLLPGVGAQGAVVDSQLMSILTKHAASVVPVSREIGALPPNVSDLAAYEVHVSAQIMRMKAELSCES